MCLEETYCILLCSVAHHSPEKSFLFRRPRHCRDRMEHAESSKTMLNRHPLWATIAPNRRRLRNPFNQTVFPSWVASDWWAEHRAHWSGLTNSAFPSSSPAVLIGRDTRRMGNPNLPSRALAAPLRFSQGA